MENIFGYQVFECLTVVFETFIVYQYVKAFFEEKRTGIGRFCGYVIFCIGLSMLSLFCRESLVLFAYTVIGTYLLEWTFYKSSLTSRFFSVFFFSIFMMGSEFACTGILRLLGDHSLDVTRDFGLYRVMCIVIAKIVQIFIVKISGIVIKWKKDNDSDVEIKHVIPLLFCQIFSIVFTYQVFIIGYEIYGHLNAIVFLCMLGIMYINIIIFWYFDRIKVAFEYKARNEAAETKLELQKQYFKMVEEHQHETNALWHDIQKHIKMIKTLINEGFLSNSEQYVKELETQIQELPEVVMTSEPFLSALLNDWLNQAKKENIDVRLDVRLKSEIKILTADLGVILSNLFENAIEACQNMTAKSEKRIDLKVLQQGSFLYIDISNTYNPQLINLKRGGRHGYGQRNIEKVIAKYGGKIEFKPFDNVYFVSIVIP